MEVQVFIVSLRINSVRQSMLDDILDIYFTLDLGFAKLTFSPGKLILELLERGFVG